MSVPMRRTTSMLEFPRPDLYTSIYSPPTENMPAGTGVVHVLSERLEEQNRVKKSSIYNFSDCLHWKTVFSKSAFVCLFLNFLTLQLNKEN